MARRRKRIIVMVDAMVEVMKRSSIACSLGGRPVRSSLLGLYQRVDQTCSSLVPFGFSFGLTLI